MSRNLYFIVIWATKLLPPHFICPVGGDKLFGVSLTGPKIQKMNKKVLPVIYLQAPVKIQFIYILYI